MNNAVFIKVQKHAVLHVGSKRSLGSMFQMAKEKAWLPNKLILIAMVLFLFLLIPAIYIFHKTRILHVGDFHGLLVFFIFTGALAKRQYACIT